MDIRASPILSCSLGEAQRMKKIRENFLLALQIRRASPIGAVKAPRFAFKRRERSSASNAFYIAPIQLALRRS
jgi:hypothetical protein